MASPRRPGIIDPKKISCLALDQESRQPPLFLWPVCEWRCVFLSIIKGCIYARTSEVLVVAVEMAPEVAAVDTGLFRIGGYLCTYDTRCCKERRSARGCLPRFRPPGARAV